ncbi:hypothetical protein D3C83_188050 [compost metagenome]
MAFDILVNHDRTAACTLELEDERCDVEVGADGRADAEHLFGEITLDHGEKAAQTLSRGVAGVNPHELAPLSVDRASR